MGEENKRFSPFVAGANICSHCGEALEYVELSAPNLGVMQFPKPCKCAGADSEAQEARRSVLLSESDRTLKDIERLMDYGPQGRFKARTFSSFKTEDGWQTKFLETVKDYADNFETKLKSMRGLLILGSVGAGKTHLSAAVANQLRAKNIPVVFGTLGYLFERLQNTYDYRPVGERVAHESDIMRLYATVPLLIIDDLGKEPFKTDQAWPWGKAKLYEIVNRRYENGLPMIVTSNITDIEVLNARTDPGIVSRILEMSDVIIVEGTNYRLKLFETHNKLRIQAG